MLVDWWARWGSTDAGDSINIESILYHSVPWGVVPDTATGDDKVSVVVGECWDRSSLSFVDISNAIDDDSSSAVKSMESIGSRLE